MAKVSELSMKDIIESAGKLYLQIASVYLGIVYLLTSDNLASPEYCNSLDDDQF